MDSKIISLEKSVKPQGNGGMVVLPKSWIGKQVKVVLLESLQNLKYNLKQKCEGNHRLTAIWIEGKLEIIRQEQLVGREYTTAGAEWYSDQEIPDKLQDIPFESGYCRKEIDGETGDVLYYIEDELGLEYPL